MFSKSRALLLAATLFSASSLAGAQECLGLRSLKYSTANMSLNWRVLQKARGPEARLIFGREHGFGGLRAGLLNIGETNRAYNWGVEAGGSFTLGKSVTVCPLAAFSYQPSADGGISYPKTTEALFGATFGVRPYITTAVKLIPFAGAGVVRSDFTGRFTELSVRLPDHTQTGLEVFGGLGVQLGEQAIIRAAARHRDGFGNRAFMYSLGVTVAPSRK